jgi:rhomboid protease GluP
MKCAQCGGTGQCSVCKGEGSTFCSRCNGEGVMDVASYSGGAKRVKCLFCHGYGTISCNPMCESCRGFGELSKPDADSPGSVIEDSTPGKKESRSFISWELLLMNLAFFVAGALCVAIFKRNYILYLCALNGERVFAGEWWRLITSMFVHLGYIHLLTNLYMLCFLAPPLEKIIGVRKFLFIYFLSGLLGNIVTIMVKPEVWSAGASGAIYGIIGAYLTLHYRSRPFYASLMGQLIIFLLIDFLIALIPAMHINVIAHLGGFVGGIVTAYVMTIPRKNSPMEVDSRHQGL